MTGFIVIASDAVPIGVVWSTNATFAARKFRRIYPEFGEVTAISAAEFGHARFRVLVPKLSQIRRRAAREVKE